MNTGKLFEEYENLWQFRLLNPEILPDTEVIRWTSAWHKTSYADSLWIGLIQFIWDNIWNNRYHAFLNPYIEKIIELHPHFPEPYNLALLLSPNINPEKESTEVQKKIIEKALEIGEKWMKNICNQSQLEAIYALEFSSALWDNPSLKNPCRDASLPYNVAITANELGSYEKAKQYFKVASVQEEGPQAARFLWPLMDGKLWDYKNAGERFLLIALEAYDEAPFVCQKIALETLNQYKTTSFPAFIEGLDEKEESLAVLKDTENPLATTENTCNGFFIRAVKQFYLAYINEVSKNHPEITTWSGLIEQWLLTKIPTLKEQRWWTVWKKNGTWKYQTY